MSTRLYPASIILDRKLPGSPRHAFRFWSDHALKRSWNGCHPDWTVLEDSFDFRIGGSETVIWRMPDGTEQSFVAHYLDVVTPERIVYAFVMRTNGVHLSSSVVSVEFAATASGCIMHYTEQAVFCDEEAARERQAGTGFGFDRMVSVIEQAVATSH